MKQRETERMRGTVAVLTYQEVDALVGKEGAGPSQTHPRVRERLAPQGIDLSRGVIAWADDGRQIYLYRNAKEGDPG